MLQQTVFLSRACDRRIDEFVGPVRKGILGEQASHYFQMILLSIIGQRKKRAIDVFFKGVMPPGWKG